MSVAAGEKPRAEGWLEVLSARAGWVSCLLLCWACKEEAPSPPANSQAGEAAVGARSQVEVEAARQGREEIEKSLNPKGLPVYSGPVGVVAGVVRVSGDPPPLVPEMIEKLPAEGCARAHDMQRKLYRQGPERTLADVLVTVTEYPGYVPPSTDAVRVEMEGCAFDHNVIAMTFGQRLDVFNLDSQAYMPRVLGPRSYALRVAIPKGAPVPLFAPRPGRYTLVEETRPYMRADVFVLNYPTFAVTGLDGRFRIERIPVGDVKVTAYAVALGKIVDQRVRVETGTVKELAFDIAFSQAEHEAAQASPPASH